MEETVEISEIYTIGHGIKLPISELIRIMEENKIELLVDIRSTPYSRWAPDYCRPGLTSKLQNKYIWKGKVLGGKGDPLPIISDETITGLAETATRIRMLLMCSETDFNKCHRHSIIARRLKDGGYPVKVIHIVGGKPIEAFPGPGQGRLFRDGHKDE